MICLKKGKIMEYNLTHFIQAQEPIYEMVILELQDGHKQSHWMWYIFPQFDGLGYSNRAKHYSIKSLGEAKAYLAHPILSARLIECCELLLSIKDKMISQILGYPDDIKLKSSMTLFNTISNNSIFQNVLDRYFGGIEDKLTVELLKQTIL